MKTIVHTALLTIALVIFFGDPKPEHAGLVWFLKGIAALYIGLMIYVNFYGRKRHDR